MLYTSKNIIVPLLLHLFVQLRLLSCKPIPGRLSPVIQSKQMTSCVGARVCLHCSLSWGLIGGTSKE